METHKLIGRKVRGFKFESTDKIYYSYLMDNLIGKIGVVAGVHTDDYHVQVEFNHGVWYYPIDQIEQHLVEDEKLLVF